MNSWLRNQPAQVISAAVASLREALAPYVDGVACACAVRCGDQQCAGLNEHEVD